MSTPSWLIELDQTHLDYAVLGTLTLAALAAGLLYRVGLIGWVLRLLGAAVRGGVLLGFRFWERFLSWAPWQLFLAVAVGLLAAGAAAAAHLPSLTVTCALATLLMGTAACLAYMFIDLERYEVERGYKAIHNPLKGQELARHLVRYGHRVGIPLLVAAAAAMIGGFALLNEGLYQGAGRGWYQPGEGNDTPGFLDFLVNALLHLLRVVDVLDLASSHHLLNAKYVRQAAWPAAALLAVFKAFFTLVLIQQIFASVRQGRLLAETIADFWSPHEPIHARARSSLPQYGAAAIRPLLESLHSVESLTKEQRDQLPEILATMGPSIIPVLLRHLLDPHEHVRAVCVATLSRLHALDAVESLGALARDPSDLVRQAAAEALGTIVGAPAGQGRRKRRLPRLAEVARRGTEGLLWWRTPVRPAARPDPTELAVAALRVGLDDVSAGVRGQAALAVARVGPAAGAARARLIALLQDSDEAVRCQAAEALGRLGGPGEAAVDALVGLLADVCISVRGAAARALGSLKERAAAAVLPLAALMRDPEESVRKAAAEAIAQIGSLDDVATGTLVNGLGSQDNMIRAQTAEALGEIGAPAREAVPALVEVLDDHNDVVRARAVEALGKLGNGAAPVAVPGLVRALRDPDNWVSALAAEALGQMADAADEAVPALIRALRHGNPLVRGNAAEALGKMGERAGGARHALEKACRDEDGSVRSHALRALGTLGDAAPTSAEAVRAGLEDADPRVRAAAVGTIGAWGSTTVVSPPALLALLDDASDQVKVEVARVLPRFAGTVPEAVERLRKSLRDDNALIQEHAAIALGKFGPAATSAGGDLLRAAQTGEASVREEAMRALAMTQPPEAARAFATGLQDASADVRMVASAGWMKATSIPEEVIPALIQGLADPEVQVRANVAHALSRLESLPVDAVPRLAECATDPNDGLRINAALALKLGPSGEVRGIMEQLVADPYLRVRLIAAGWLLANNPGNERAITVVGEALADPAFRLRKAALALVESLGEKGEVFVEHLRLRDALEEDSEARRMLGQLLNRLLARGNRAASVAAMAEDAPEAQEHLEAASK
jgi:HEAT repeat protein